MYNIKKYVKIIVKIVDKNQITAYLCITITHTIKTNNMKKGTKVTNEYGQKLTVLEVIDGTMVRVYEDFNNLYHITKLFVAK